MVVDTSAVIAIILGEDERPIFTDLILRQPIVVMSVISVVEIAITLLARRREPDAGRLDETLSTFAIEMRGVDVHQGMLARQAFTQFGRGRHPAALNFGDCFVLCVGKSAR